MKIVYILLVLIAFLSFSVSATIVRLDTSKYVDAHGVRNWVVRGACALDVMVPTETSGEWSAFRSNSPACVSFMTCNPSEVCCDNDGDIRPDGFLVESGSSDCALGSPNCCFECRDDTVCSGSSGTSTYIQEVCETINDGLRCEDWSWTSSYRSSNCERQQEARTCNSGVCTGDHVYTWANYNEGNVCQNWYWTNTYQNNDCQREQRRNRCSSGSCVYSGSSTDNQWVNVNENQYCGLFHDNYARYEHALCRSGACVWQLSTVTCSGCSGTGCGGGLCWYGVATCIGVRSCPGCSASCG